MIRSLARAPRRGALPAALAAAVLLAGCGRTHELRAADRPHGRYVPAPITDGVSIGYTTSGARFVTNLIGFHGPETALYDPDQDVYFVSNMTGYGSAKDDNGYITRIDARDPQRSSVLVQGGKRGAVLHSPKGLAIHGDTLWTADIDALRGFDRHTGAPLATIDLAAQHAILLNDLSVGTDGTIRVTDTGILMDTLGIVPVDAGRVFVIGPNRAVTVIPMDHKVPEPNGIAWDPFTRQWVVVSFDQLDGVVAVLGPDGSLQRVLFHGAGQLDGLEVLPSGNLLFSSWADSSVHLLAHGRDVRILRALRQPAGIGIDTKRDRLLVPMPFTGWVQVWDIGPALRRAGAAARR